MRKVALILLVAVASVWAFPADQARADVPDLVKAISSDNKLPARVEAIDNLAVLGPEAAEAVPELTKSLDDESPAIRAHAARALGMIGPKAKPAAKALIERVTDNNRLVRREAVEALGKIRPGAKVTAPLMKKLLKDADPAVRLRAMRSMAEYGKPAVPLLIEALGEKDSCGWACLILSEIGPDAVDAVPALLKVLDDDRPEVHREAILALGKIGPGAAPAVASLTAELDSKEPGIPLAAAYALGAIGPEAKPAVEKLGKLAKSDDDLPKTVATWALARIQPDDQELRITAAKALIEGLKSDDAGARVAAARGLSDLDPKPGEFTPLFVAAFEGQDEAVLTDALDALATLGAEAVPGLIKALSIEKAQKSAAYILGKLGPVAKQAVPALIDAAGSDDAETRREVFFALGKIGPPAKKAVPVLTKALGDSCEKCRYAAIFALGKIGPAAESAKKDLLEQLGGDDEFAAMISAWALAQIDPACTEAAPKSVPLLTKALENANPQIRLEAAGALAKLGELAKSAAPALEKAAADDSDVLVRKQAAKALKAVGGK